VFRHYGVNHGVLGVDGGGRGELATTTRNQEMGPGRGDLSWPWPWRAGYLLRAFSYAWHM